MSWLSPPTPSTRASRPCQDRFTLKGMMKTYPVKAVLHVRLIDASDPEARLVVTETTLADLGRFPIKFELPSEGVQTSRHRRYELEAEIVLGDETLYHIIPRDEWRRTRLPYCPNADQQIVNSVFPVSEFPKE